ncbi:MAG: hypothetical protein IT385_11805 [Deltaproteobacteria bacterium]|nr:hypothetical protein [Deltaproteobacteria bacterium]
MALRRPPWLPDPAVVADLFPDLSALALARAVASSLATRASNAAARRLVKILGNRRIAPLVRVVGAQRLARARAAGRPVVLVAWHAGLVALLGAALVALDLEALVLRHHEGSDADGIAHVSTRGGSALALHRAVRHARAGGVVLIVLDVLQLERPTAGRTPLLGRRVQLPRGPAALARLAGADLVCVAPRLGPRGVEVHLSDPLPRGDDDRATMIGVARWWESWLLSHPGDLWPESARAIARYPRG